MSLSAHAKKALIKFVKEKKLAITSHYGFKNFTKSINLAHALVFDVKDVPSLIKLIQQIYFINKKLPVDEKLVMRVAAGGRKPHETSYSFNEAVEAHLIIRLVGDEFRAISKTEQTDVIQVGASVKIGQLEKTLYEKHDLALSTSSLIPHVTVAGLAANAGHGTGKDEPSFAGLIKAMTLCLPNGKVVRIDESQPNFEVIRAAHLGAFGIVISMEVKCISAQKIECKKEVLSLPQFLTAIKDKIFLKDPYVSAMYVPTYQADELDSVKIKNVVVYHFRPVSKLQTNLNDHRRDQWKQLIKVKLQKKLHFKNLLQKFPSIIPTYMKLIAKDAIGKQNSISIKPWPDIHYQTFFPSDLTNIDCLFEVSEDCHEIIEAMIKTVQCLQLSAREGFYPVSYAVYVRLFAGTNGGLSTSLHQENKKVCGLDIVSTQKLKGYTEFKDRMMNYFFNELKGKPHWGKYIPEQIDFSKLYGENYSHFLATFKNWYQQENIALEDVMYLNPFLKNILSERMLTQSL